MIVMQMLTVPVGSAHWKYRRNKRKMLATSTGIFFGVPGGACDL